MKQSKRRSAAPRRVSEFMTKRRLAWVVGAGVLVACVAIFVAVTYWDNVRQVPAQRLVKVFLQRGCACAGPWIAQLEDAGFVVDKYDAGDMHLLRRKKQVPDHLQGCHLGEYLGYFIDGHMPATGFHALARQHPDALGIGMASDMVVVNTPIATSMNNKDALIIFDRTGVARLWSPPALSAAAPLTSPVQHGSTP